MKQLFGKAAAALLSVLTVSGLFFGCGAKEKPAITGAAQLNDSAYTVGIAQGAAVQTVVAQAYPNARTKYYNKEADGYSAVQQGEIDAFVHDRVMMEFAIARGLTGVKLLPEAVGEPTSIAVGISPESAVPDLQGKLNAFIAELRADGTLDDMYRRWITEASEIMPDIPKPENPALTVKIGTTGLFQPFSYYKGARLHGYDIELIQRFALWMNADVKVATYDYDGMVAAAQSGSIDCIIANLNVTEERKQSILFSDTIYESCNVVMVRGDETSAAKSSRVPVETARVGVMDGSTNEIYAEKHYPDANRQNFKNYVDSTAALSAGKLDYAMMDYTNALRFTRNYPDLEIASEFLTDEKLCIGVNKNNPKLYAEVNEVMNKFLTDGTVDAAVDHWIKPDGSAYDNVETPKLENAPKIKVAIVSSREPTTFMMDNRYVGLDIEIIDRILYELGYQPEYMDMEWGAVIVAIGSGKADMTLGMYNTPERAEKLLFTDPYFTNPQLLVARKTAGAQTEQTAVVREALDGATGSTSFSEGLKQSFRRTFITEDRWKLVLNGLMVTVLLSVCSGVFGSILGFGICMLRRSQRRLAYIPAAGFIRLIQGTPIVVLLMILYYIIFGKMDISAILVAILGFSVNFSVYVSEMLRTGIDAVDRGQIEAARALGFTKVRTFWKITFPQAARHFLPIFKGEFISMVKMTSVVGYIAIQDLTKVSDIIRSRTLEAFFPLVVTAVLYFIVANTLTILLSHLEIRLDPKRRKSVLKGVVTK